MPEAGSDLEIRHVLDAEGAEVKGVSLLAGTSPVEWRVEESLLKLTVPEPAELNELANVFKVEYQ
jgi:hypothetical protein